MHKLLMGRMCELCICEFLFFSSPGLSYIVPSFGKLHQLQVIRLQQGPTNANAHITYTHVQREEGERERERERERDRERER
jgi:hypothetical protein